MKIALTGATGMLGHDIRRVCADDELFPLSHADLDITDLESARSAIKKIRPDFVINAAAYTDVDGCETDYEKAYLVNGVGARNMAIACEEAECPIVQISTDYVFDGSHGRPYDEWDTVNPVNKYGLSKLIGERFVSFLTNRFYIVRTSWLFGRNGKNFVDTIIRLLAEKESIDVVSDQTGSPTFTYDLAVALRELLGRGYGVYHITNSSQCSWYEFAVEIGRLQESGKRINPTTSDRFKRPAKRPAYSVLGNTMLKLEGVDEPRHWKDALKAYLSQ